MQQAHNNTSNTKIPPSKSKGILSDIRVFLLNKPKYSTLVKFESEANREFYSNSIMQRTGINVNKYGVLNMHRIGIEVPASYVFEELLKWNGDSSCWPNHIAKVNRVDNRLEKIGIFLFGWSKYPFGAKNGIFGYKYLNLFNLNAIRIQKKPDPSDNDNARYLLYESTGGYPIGIFSMYVRTSIAERNEKEKSQLFLLVSFNFYGKERTSKIRFRYKIWESIHNRVTANIMNRFKQLCEWRFDRIQNGLDH